MNSYYSTAYAIYLKLKKVLLRLTSSSAHFHASFSFVCYSEDFFQSYDNLKPRGLPLIYNLIWPAKFSFHDKQYLFFRDFWAHSVSSAFFFGHFPPHSLFFSFPHWNLTHFVSRMSWKTQTPQSFQSAVHVLLLSGLKHCGFVTLCYSRQIHFNTSRHIFYRFVHCEEKVCRVAERV